VPRDPSSNRSQRRYTEENYNPIDLDDNDDFFDPTSDDEEAQQFYESLQPEGFQNEYGGSNIPDSFGDEDSVYRDETHLGRSQPEYGSFSNSDYNDMTDDLGDDQTTEKDALYDAYNTLHTLAQDFQKPFDAPAVIVVGHQSSGKSALIEALMGFQFNQVGGGTKTRRPVALRMQYNPDCTYPRCYLQCEDGVERPKTMAEIQDYIQRENKRLEQDPVRCFDSREINIRMEYKYCPNMILIDTPGLISAPKLRGQNTNMEQRALLASAREAERLVVQKMRCPDYIILCVEDTSDWKHGATREIVQKADPDLSRTVIVQTKLDTKIPQFGTSADVQEFLGAEIIDSIAPRKMGGPFFTSVPSGRVGRAGMHEEDSFYLDDEEFVMACAQNEEKDRKTVHQRLERMSNVNIVNKLIPRVGLSKLRGFLERKVDDQYRRNVAKIVPLLKAEHASAKKRLEACERELEALSLDRMKTGAEKFCDEFCAALKDAIQGTIVAPPSLFGETLQQENLAAGSFYEIQSCPMAVSSRTWDMLLTSEVGNAEHRLYGGSQYHRALREFSLASRCLRLPPIAEDEIANAVGVGDRHDGVNFLRAACVIAVEKAQISFDPMLEALRLRMAHVMTKMYAVCEYMIRQKRERNQYSYPGMLNNKVGEAPTGATDITNNPMFRQMTRTIYERFVQSCSDSVMMRCRDDLTALTRFVTWDLNDKGGGAAGALRRSLPEQADMVQVYQVAVKHAEKDGKNGKSLKTVKKVGSGGDSGNGVLSATSSDEVQSLTSDGRSERDYLNLLQIIEEAAMSRDANRTILVVGGLVQHIISLWRVQYCKSVTTKFNCFFLMPFVDEFQLFFRTELLGMYEGDLCEVFDLGKARKQLEIQRDQLLNECEANKRLQDKFDQVARMIREQDASASPDKTTKNF